MDMATSQGRRVAVVTGAASGIGRASALAFAGQGDAVVVSDIDEAGGEETVRRIRDGGGEASFVRADVTDEADVEALVSGTVDRYGRLDVAHNNAGHGGSPALTADYAREDWDRLIALNLTGTWLCLKHEIPQMLAGGGGAIVNTASTFGMVGVQGMCAYVASKHGVVGLTKAAALEYAAQGVRVNAICPGATRTPQLEAFWADIDPADPESVGAQYVAKEPIGRLGRPEEIAAAVVWLCSDAASFVTGHPMVADGGWLAQ
jgi:NAD(P)-dependent dehydrogenase (short-subunit alcohol dehydrogenase family)